MTRLNKQFLVTSISRADLESLGFDLSQVPKEIMERLAGRLADNCCENLDFFAEGLEIPRHPPTLPR